LSGLRPHSRARHRDWPTKTRPSPGSASCRSEPGDPQGEGAGQSAGPLEDRGAETVKMPGPAAHGSDRDGPGTCTTARRLDASVAAVCTILRAHAGSIAITLSHRSSALTRSARSVKWTRSRRPASRWRASSSAATSDAGWVATATTGGYYADRRYRPVLGFVPDGGSGALRSRPWDLLSLPEFQHDDLEGLENHHVHRWAAGCPPRTRAATRGG
jgi:hypothetical protein